MAGRLNMELLDYVMKNILQYLKDPNLNKRIERDFIYRTNKLLIF